MLNIMEYKVCPMLRETSPSRYFPVFFMKTRKYCGLGDGLIDLAVLVTTTAVVKEMPPPITRKPLSLG